MAPYRVETWNGGAYAYEEDAWVATGRLHIYSNAVNLEIEKPLPPFQYEQVCFLELIRQHPAKFILGPNLLDYLFDEHPMWGGHIRPDAFVFSMNGTMKLTEFAEFRLGRMNARYKLEGFQDLLHDLRCDIKEFSRMVMEEIGAHIDVPREWEIPRDREFDVTFMVPTRKATIYQRNVPFKKVEQRVVPFQEES